MDATSLPPNLRAAVAGLPKRQRLSVATQLIGHPERWDVPPPPVAVIDASALPPPASRTSSAPTAFSCPHEGPILDRWRSGCPNRVALHSVRECRHPGGAGRCVRERQPAHAADVRTCHGAGCPLVTRPAVLAPPWPPADGFTRHLLYYVYPVAANGVWQKNVDQLLERVGLFNGRRIVVIARQAGLVNHKRERRGQRPPHTVDGAELVRERLAGHNCEIIEIDNDGGLGEVAAHELLWGQVANLTGPTDVTFYAHAKGVTRPVNVGVSVHPWTSLLYAANLDYWPVVAELLSHHPVAGAMKTVGHVPAYGVSWHFSGTFFWFRNAAAFGRDWRAFPHVYGGVEAWPGSVFGANEAGCVFYEESVRPRVTGYDFDRLRMVLRQFAEWGERNADKRRPGAVPWPWQRIWGYE